MFVAGLIKTAYSNIENQKFLLLLAAAGDINP
jgi:hypothetical protein